MHPTGMPLTADAISRSEEIPGKFLEVILVDLRRAGVVRSQRGADGGYWLARSADEVTIAELIRAVDGPLAHVRGMRPELVSYAGASEHLTDVWVALRASIRRVLESVTLADVLAGELPAGVHELVSDPESWSPH